MGKRALEKATGLTYEQRVEAAKSKPAKEQVWCKVNGKRCYHDNCATCETAIAFEGKFRKKLTNNMITKAGKPIEAKIPDAQSS